MTGIVSGTPTNLAVATAYTVTATNAAGSSSVALNITVNVAYPQLLVGQMYIQNPVGEYDAITGAVTHPSFLPSGYDALGLAVAGNSLFVVEQYASNVLQFNATTGALINGSFVSGLSSPRALAVSGNTLYVVFNGGNGGNSVGSYDATTGAVINANLIPQVLGSSLAVCGNTLFMNNNSFTVVSAFDATTGATLNAKFINSINTFALASSDNTLFVADYENNKVNAYDAATGSLLRSFLVGANPQKLAIAGNTLYITQVSSVGAYNATTGAAINASLISGINGSYVTGLTALPPVGAPAGLTYSANPAVYSLAQTIVPNLPTSSGGGIASYSISPPLPAGLSLNPALGVIAGTPTEVSPATDYTVVASNPQGTTNVVVNVTVNASSVGGAPPTTVAYSINPAVYSLGVPISANSPIYSGGAPTAYSISPALPPGLSFNAATGVITGTPTSETPAGSYTVNAANLYGCTTATLSIIVEDTPPSAVAYTSNPAVYTLGVAIPMNLPSSAGSPVLSYTVSPPLPSGLALNTKTGVISGTPMIAAPASIYTVTARNGGGFATAALSIAIVDVPPSALAYATNPAIYPIGAPAANNFPTSIGSPVLSYSVAPALPAGLVLNPSTGVISGTPTTVSAAANYTVTAMNDAGSCTLGLNLSVFLPGPQLLVGQVATGVDEYDAITGASIHANFVVASVPQAIALSGNTLFVATQGNNSLGEYNATTGAIIDANFIKGRATPYGLALSGNTLFVVDNSRGVVGAYNASTGAAINASLITGLQSPKGIVLSGNSLFLTINGVKIGVYNATTGAAINANFVTGLGAAAGLALSGNTLFVANGSSTNTVGAYNATTGAAINANFITGLSSPDFLALLGNTLLVGNYTGKVGAYNASNGAVINSSFIVGRSGLTGLAIFPDAAPSTLAYTVNSAVYTTGVSIVPNTPSISGGQATAYSVSPQLPAGLTLNLGSGVITGTPTATAPASAYTVTAANPGGSTTATIQLAVVSPLDVWRQQFFGTASNSGAAADNADPYHTGIPNLLVYAFCGPGQNPASASLSMLPQIQIVGGNLVFTFTQPTGATGVTYGAECSTATAADHWQSIADTGIGNVHVFSAPISGNAQMFMRLTVSNP